MAELVDAFLAAHVDSTVWGTADASQRSGIRRRLVDKVEDLEVVPWMATRTLRLASSGVQRMLTRGSGCMPP